jgi:hypothetical protein
MFYNGRMKSLLALALATSCLVSGMQQSDSGHIQKEAMAKLSFILGEWKGSGTTSFGHELFPFDQQETISSKCDGLLFSIERKHDKRSRDFSIKESIGGYTEFGTISYDEESQRYVVRMHRSDGSRQEYALAITAEGLKWKCSVSPWGEVVYTAVLSADSWTILGEILRDGVKHRVSTWQLRRVQKS